MEQKKIEIYTDGSCLGNPGPGGWGVIIHYHHKILELAGNEKATTNNRMEMTAIMKSLDWIRNDSGITHSEIQNHKILIYSDSNLLIQTMSQGWKRKANTDLWAEIDRLRAWLDIDWIWVKAHATNKYNNLVDKIAFREAKKAKAK